ncbi:MAG: nitrite reductase [Thermodesulfobacteriota bacterium]
MGTTTDTTKVPASRSLTVVLSGGVLPLPLLKEVEEITTAFKGVGVYLTTIQNLRLTGIAEADLAEVRARLAKAGADLKGPGRYPKPKVCTGAVSCNLGLVDTLALCDRIWSLFKDRTGFKPKLKVAIAACPASCSNATLADIGAVATRQGFDLYVGGKGGTRPQVGRRVLRGIDEDALVAAIVRLIEYHQEKTGQKQRMRKLIDEADFPFPAAE